MSKTIESIIKNKINVSEIAKAIRAEGYKTKTEKKRKSPAVLVGGLLERLRSPDRFQKLEDGWVKDSLLGIDWGPSSSNRMNWGDAKKYCVDQKGRLPEIDELASLADRSKRDPAINTEAFPDTKTDDWYWTATEVAGFSGNAWLVDFDEGYVGYCFEDGDGYVRPVRSSQ